MNGGAAVVGQPVTSVDTPALVVDLDVLDGNIARIAGACRDAGVAWRPHVKGIKVPQIIERCITAGAIGVTCAKVSEAEVFAAAGITDILIANQVVGPVKLQRLMALRRVADVIVAVDHVDHVRALGAAVRTAGVTLRVVVEVDLGLSRAGLLPGPGVVALARAVEDEPGLVFAGLMGWEARTTTIADPAAKALAVQAAVAGIVASAEACRAAGLRVGIVSCGGTGTYPITACIPGVTEIQAGGGVLSDVRYRTAFHIDHPYALTVRSTVTSRADPRRIVCDAGRKAMTTDGGTPLPLGLTGVRSLTLSAEHTTIELEQPTDRPWIGDQLVFAVGYGDTTVNLHDELIAVRDGVVTAIWSVAARGRIH